MWWGRGGSRLRKYLRLFRKARKRSFSLEGQMVPAFSCLVMHSVRGSGAKNSLGWTGRLGASFRQRSEPRLSLNPHPKTQLFHNCLLPCFDFFLICPSEPSRHLFNIIVSPSHGVCGGGGASNQKYKSFLQTNKNPCSTLDYVYAVGAHFLAW